MEILNHDIVGLYNRINRFIYESMHCTASNTSEVNEFDVKRLKQYLEAVIAYHDHVISQPQLDLPETSPRFYTLKEKPVMLVIENESIADCCRLFEICRDELINSQSTRVPAGLIVYDSERLMAIIDKITAFITDYVEKITPLDLPESSPREALTPKGRTGLKKPGA